MQLSMPYVIISCHHLPVPGVGDLRLPWAPIFAETQSNSLLTTHIPATTAPFWDDIMQKWTKLSPQNTTFSNASMYTF